MNDYHKGLKKAKSLIVKAEQYRDKHGYRENLGYDSRPKLTSYLGTLDLAYSEQCRILDYFDNGCHGI